MLVGEDRVLGHRLAAAWLEEAGERDALTLAEHFDRGQASERAVVWYQRAAEQALEGNDLDAAIARGERAIGLGAEGPALAALLQIQAEAYKWRGRQRGGRDRRRRKAMAAAPRGSETWCAAAGEVVAASGKLGDRAALVEVARGASGAPRRRWRDGADRGHGPRGHAARAGRAGRRRGEAARPARIGLERGEQSCSRRVGARGACRRGRSGGDPGARVRLADAAAESFDAAGDLRNACLQRVSVGYAYNEIGAYAEAEKALRGAIGVAERMGLDNAVGTARAQLGRTLGRRGGLEEARAVLARAIETLRAQKNMRLAAVATQLPGVGAGRAGRRSRRRSGRLAAPSAGARGRQRDAGRRAGDAVGGAARARCGRARRGRRPARAHGGARCGGKDRDGRGGDPPGPVQALARRRGPRRGPGRAGDRPGAHPRPRQDHPRFAPEAAPSSRASQRTPPRRSSPSAHAP